MIKNDAIINEDTSANVSQLKSEIRRLKQVIKEFEIGRASLDCEVAGLNPSFISPSSKTQTKNSTKTQEVNMRPEGGNIFNHISPSMLSSHLPEDAD